MAFSYRFNVVEKSVRNLLESPKTSVDTFKQMHDRLAYEHKRGLLNYDDYHYFSNMLIAAIALYPEHRTNRFYG